MDLSLERLYLLYKAGLVSDGKNNSNVLQVAKAVGKDLTLAEFEWIVTSVGQVEKQFDPRKQSRDFQANLWSIPDEAKARRKTDFQPTRDSKNQPIQLDDASPESLERILKSKSQEEVKHNSTLRNAWHAAQSGKLSELIEGNNLWAISGCQDELTAGLRGVSPSASIDSLGLSIAGLKRANKEGTLDAAIAKERKAAEEELPSFLTYKSYGLDAMKERILSDNGKFSFLPESMREDVHDGKSLKYIRGISDRDERANAASAWAKGFRDTHEQSVQQSVIDRRLSGFAAGQSQSSRVEQKPTLEMLRQSVMSTARPEARNSSDVVVPPVQSAITGDVVAPPTQNVVPPPVQSTNRPAHRSTDRPTLDAMRQSYVASNVEGKSDPGANDKVHYSPHEPTQDSGSGDDAKKQNEGMSPLDWLQLAMDFGGAIEPTPFTDLANAGVSLARAALDPKNAGRHLMNAGISLVSTIPYAGDIAKIGKGYGKGGKAVGKAFEGFANSKAGKAAYRMFGESRNAGLGGTGGSGGSGNGRSGSSGESVGGNGPNGGESNTGSTSDWLLETLDKYKYVAAGATALIIGFRQLNQWVIKTAESGQALIESQRELAKYSGELSNALAKSDTANVLRDIRKAEYLGASASSLSGAQSAYQDAKAFRDAPGQRTANNFSAMITHLATIVTYVESFTSGWNMIQRGFYMLNDAVLGNKPTDPTSGIEALFQKMDRDKAAEDAKKNPPKPEPPRLAADQAPAGLQQRINRLNIR